MEPVGLAIARMPSSFFVGIFIVTVAVLVIFAARKAGKADGNEKLSE